jgi:hypothetical protein
MKNISLRNDTFEIHMAVTILVVAFRVVMLCVLIATCQPTAKCSLRLQELLFVYIPFWVYWGEAV